MSGGFATSSFYPKDLEPHVYKAESLQNFPPKAWMNNTECFLTICVYAFFSNSINSSSNSSINSSSKSVKGKGLKVSAEKPKAGSDSGIGSGQNSMSSSAGKGAFTNDVTQIWIFWHSPSPVILNWLFYLLLYYSLV